MFLDRARQLLLDRGYHGLTMDAIARLTGYSRGTIYLHFRCKEDLIMSLVNRGMTRRLDMVERAAAFNGGTREQMQAIGEAVILFMSLYSGDARIFHVGDAEAIKQKASPSLLDEYNELLQQTMSVAVGVIRNAIDAGDLVLQGRCTPEILTFNLWAITEEGLSPPSTWAPFPELGIPDLLVSVLDGCEKLCDGCGWRPLSSEWDYEETRRRVREALFSEETRQVLSPEAVMP